MWRYDESGSGRPLILLHGIGMSHAAWDPVLPQLRAARRVIAFDIAGFGLTPPLPGSTPPTVANLVEAMERSLREIGVALPVDVAGNSLGGWMALEAARRGIARSAVAISPAGLWETHGPSHVRFVFGALRLLVRYFPRPVKAVLRSPAMRELALAVPVSTGSRRMPLDAARRIVDDLAASTAFEATFEHSRAPFSGTDIRVPVVVAFGDRDWIIPRRSRYRGGLPAHAKWIDMPGWGHVPMWVDPAGVSRVILEGTA